MREQPNLISKIDHLVYVVQDLHQGIEDIESLTGVRPAIAGRHQGQGTWNALMSFGPNIYFEVIAPDPEQDNVSDPSWKHTIEKMPKNRLVRWCAKGGDLQERVQTAQKLGLDLGEIKSGSREKNDGAILSWSLTDFNTFLADGMIPFFINWGSSDHPSYSLPGGCSLIHLEGVHPEAKKMQAYLDAFQLPMKVFPGNEKRLMARLKTPKGEVVLM